jgi:acyl-CoA thioester hydrolase
MADSILTYRGTIYPWHCDHMGHMNVMWYVGKFDEATWQLLGSFGLSAKRLHEGKIGLVAAEQRIEYKRELLAGDLIAIHSFIQEMREKALVFVHEMTNQGTQELAARTVLTGVCIDINTRRARPLPADIRERMVSAFPESGREKSAGGGQ